MMIIQLGIGAPRLPNVMEGGKIMKHIWSLFRNKVQAMAGFCFVLLSWRWIYLVDLPMIGLCRSWSVAWFEFLEVLERLNMTTAFTPQTKDVDGWMKSCFSLELECLGRYFFSTCDHVCEIFRGIVCTMNPENWEDMPLFWNPEGIDPLTDLLEVATVIDANRRTLQLSKAGCYLRLRTWFESSQRCGQIRHWDLP